MSQSAVELTALLCRRFEGFKAKPYLCPAGVPTIGYGSTYYAPGKPVSLKDPPIQQRLAEVLLLTQIEEVYLPGVLSVCPNLSKYPTKLAAITDFAYNLGVTKLKGSTLKRRILEEDWGSVCVELKKWVRGGGKILPGLVARREAEAALIKMGSV